MYNEHRMLQSAKAQKKLPVVFIVCKFPIIIIMRIGLKVIIYKTTVGYKMKVDEVPEEIYVERIK